MVDLNRKGVCYDVGRVMMEGNWRPRYERHVVRRELEIIKNDLHCDSVRICGLDVNRLITAAEEALTLGLEVWLSPEMWDRSQEENLEYVTEAAAAAEELRRRWPNRLVLSVGSELTIFMQGIVEGSNFFERMNAPSFWETIRAGRHNAPLNAFLLKAVKAVHEVFHGQVTYFSVPLETVEWEPFDFVGVDLYRDTRIKDSYGSMVKKYLIHGKPVIIGEFGCCTYRGAEVLGGNGFIVSLGMMVDYLNIEQKLPVSVAETLKIPPRADGHFIRDESLQAHEIIDQLRVLDSVGVEGAFVFTFVSPTSPYNEDPRYDSDMASFSMVKSYADKETAREIARQTARQCKALLGVEVSPETVIKMISDVGKHGAKYTDMSWEPKASFYAVSEFYNVK